MLKYELTPAQAKNLEQKFISMTNKEGWVQKFELMNERFHQLAKVCMTLTPNVPEQEIALQKMQEAQMWFRAAIEKNEF